MIGALRNMVLIYPVIALIVLGAGILLNCGLGTGLASNVSPLTAFMTLLAIYTVLHLIALAVCFVVSIVVSDPARGIVFIAISFFILLASSAVLWQDKGVHLFVIFAFSLFVISLYRMLVVHAAIHS